MATNSTETEESRSSEPVLNYFENLSHRLGLEEKFLTTIYGRTFYEDVGGEDVSSRNILSRFFADITAKDSKALQNLHKNYIKTGGNNFTSSRDLMFTILTHCDPFLMQDVLRKMVNCNIAVPIFLTDVKSSQVRFLLWELKQCFKLRYDKKSRRFLKTNLTLHSFMTISAVRFGEVKESKSAILNQLLKELNGYGHHESFMKENPKEMKSTLSEGIIEGAWYVPNDKSTTQFPICLLNLIGDALEHKHQLTISYKNSQICMVFSQFSVIKGDTQRIKNICKAAHVILFLFCSKTDNVQLFQKMNVTLLKIYDVPDKTHLSKVIKQIKLTHDVKSESFRALEKFEVSLKGVTPKVFRLAESCERAKQVAKELSQSVVVSGSLTLQKKMFPLQHFFRSDNMKETTQKAKNDEKLDLMQLRTNQRRITLSEEVKKFILSALDKDKLFVNFFCIWLQIYLRNKSIRNVKVAIDSIQYEVEQRRRVYAKVRTLKSPQTQNWPSFRRSHSYRKGRKEKEAINKNELDATKTFDKGVVGLEHFIRELAEIVESEHTALTQEDKNLAGDMIEFNADFLINGHYIDFFYNDAYYLPVQWFTNVMTLLQNKLKTSATVRVISVFGGTSSGKSHFLNCTFGTNFPEGEGRCTTGARMALVQVHDENKGLTGCDFLIIIDTESVSVSESTSQLVLRRNDCISTLVCSISDIVIINIGKDDTTEEITGLLSIFLRGLQKVIDIRDEMKALIVQQYNVDDKEPVPAVIHKKMMRIIANFAKKQKAASEKGNPSKVNLHTELMKLFFINQIDAMGDMHFKSLLRPKLSGLSKHIHRCSCDIKNIRKFVLQMLQSGNYMDRLVTECGDQVADVLFSIKKDNFVEAFKAATEKRKRANFLSRCGEKLTSIQNELDTYIKQTCEDLEYTYNSNNKIVHEIFAAKMQHVANIAKLVEVKHSRLKCELIEESQKTYFQYFLSDVDSMIKRIELSCSSQTKHAENELNRTAESIQTLDNFLKKARSKLEVAEEKIRKASRTSKDQIWAAKDTKIEHILKTKIKDLEKFVKLKQNELKEDILQSSVTITGTPFSDPHLKRVNDDVESILESLLATLLDDLKSTAKAANEVVIFNDQLKEKLLQAECEINKEVFASSSEFAKCSDNIDEMLNKKNKVIKQLIQTTLSKVQSEMGNVIEHSETLSYKILENKIGLAREDIVKKVSQDMKKLAELTKKTKSVVDREVLDENFSSEFNGILHEIRQDLEEKITFLCTQIEHATDEDIAKVIKYNEDEFTKTASSKFDSFVSNVTEWDKSNLHDQKITSLLEGSRTCQHQLTEKIKTKLKEALHKKQSSAERYNKVHEEIGQFLKDLKAQIPENVSKKYIDIVFKDLFDSLIKSLKEKYPMRTFDEVDHDTERKLVEKIKALGHNISTLFNCSNSSKEIRSMAHISSMSNRFCIVKGENDVALNMLENKFRELAQDYIHFDQTAEKAIKLVKSFEEKCNVMVERVTLFSFLCAKFVAVSHEDHLSAELEALKGDKSKWKLALGEEETDFDELNFAKEIKEVITMGGSYVIKYTEPLNFASLEDKVKLVCSILNTQTSDRELATISAFLTPTTVNKYHYLPFTIKTIQTVDSCLVRLLPSMTYDDMNNIGEAVYEAKLSIIGKCLAKIVPQVNRFFGDLYKIVEFFPKTNNHAEVKSASLIHLSAWSSPLISSREYEREEETNVAHIAKNQEKKCLMNLYNECDHVYDELVAEVFCNEIERSLEYSIGEEFALRLLKTIPTEYNEGGFKKKYIVTILDYLLENKNHFGLIQFVNGLATCEKWALKFLAKECFTDKRERIEDIENTLIAEHIALSTKSIERAKLACEDVPHKTLRFWLQNFQNNFNIRIGSDCMEGELYFLQANAKVIDFENFSQECLKILKSTEIRLREKLKKKKESNEATQVWLLSLPSDAATQLCSIVKGCGKQCPQCGHPCMTSSASHQLHETSVHIPKGIKGAQNERNILLPTLCIGDRIAQQNSNTDTVLSKDSELTQWKFPDEEKESLVFWKYVFCKFNKEFATYYECVESVPKDWDFTKDAALRSLQLYFEDLQKIARDSVIAV